MREARGRGARWAGTAVAAVAAAVAVSGCAGGGSGGGGGPSAAPDAVPTAVPSITITVPSAVASAVRPAGAVVLFGQDQLTRRPGLPAAAEYQRTWDRLAEACTDDPVTLTTVVNRVYRARHEPNRYQAMVYLTARQGDRRGPCAAYGGNAGSPAS